MKHRGLIECRVKLICVGEVLEGREGVGVGIGGQTASLSSYSLSSDALHELNKVGANAQSYC